MRRQLVLEEWNKFSAAIGLAQAGELQRTEMRRAFYGGATAAFYGIMLSLGHEPEATEADLDTMSGVDRELKEFAEKLKAGQA